MIPTLAFCTHLRPVGCLAVAKRRCTTPLKGRTSCPPSDLRFPAPPRLFLSLPPQRYDAIEVALEQDAPGAPAAVLTVSNAPKFFSNGIDPVWSVDGAVNHRARVSTTLA